jgi:peptidoglycan/xylan/chitin deacetylase (PgdA/CDA1 family)
MKGTFFMNGQNYGSIYDSAAVVQRIYNDGHQVASHTYVKLVLIDIMAKLLTFK